MLRLLKLQPAAVGSTAAVVYAAGAMLYRATVAHTGVLDWDLLVAAGTTVWGLWTYGTVTPLMRPRDAQGRSLAPHVPAADRTPPL